MRSSIDTSAAPAQPGFFSKLPRELRDAIYEEAFDPDGEGIEIMGPRSAGLQSLLQVNKEICVEVQEVLPKCMKSQILFKATCYSSEDIHTAMERARTMFSDIVPPIRRMTIICTSKEEHARKWFTKFISNRLNNRDSRGPYVCPVFYEDTEYDGSGAVVLTPVVRYRGESWFGLYFSAEGKLSACTYKPLPFNR
jgi:hypothetical protein